tara:strand:+ start:334 stop:462 length:129 start_codon:yes stop_codon:yes gene_type:complete
MVVETMDEKERRERDKDLDAEYRMDAETDAILRARRLAGEEE